MRGEGSEEDALESMRLFWPAYYASRANVPPMPPMRLSVEAYAELLAAAQSATCDVGAIRAPLGIVVGAESPMPYTQSAEPTVTAIPGAWLDVVPDAGHFPWFEAPGCVRAALTRLLAH
jgi:pimeloyl-ACP methyl ester carboxylesterase